ncbi:unnamed protein product [Ranitomeya imitator]|uniref:Uncharacterized protein n=1 Tax=Ranitomeya imitator TaxID=111125 RepID=A0ABN9L0T9_9NEOB|nr:unnamed protein product [Ranitomeya imitator]
MECPLMLNKVCEFTASTAPQSSTWNKYNVLQKGLSFCPTPSFNGFTLDQELHRFFRSLRLKAHFSGSPIKEQVADTSSSSQSEIPFQLKQLGLRVPKIDALRSLKENKRIVIKPADKGGSIVIMDKSHYVSIIQSQLNDRTTYQPIDRDPTFDVARGDTPVFKNI